MIFETFLRLLNEEPSFVLYLLGIGMIVFSAIMLCFSSPVRQATEAEKWEHFHNSAIDIGFLISVVGLGWLMWVLFM